MPVVDRRRMSEYGVKGVHLAARVAGMAPEQRKARRLAAEAPDKPPSGPRVAFLTPRDWSVHVQWEAMIAQALRLRGADVHFVTCGGGLDICDRANTWEGPPMPCTSCSRYVGDSLDAHGFPQVQLRAGWEADDPAEWPELDEVGLSSLGSVEADGLPLGELTRIPVAWFLMRESHMDDPLAAGTWRAFLRSARRMAAGLRAALDRIEPDVVVLLNGLFSFDAVALALCRERDIDVVTYERGFIKETLIFRHGEPAALTPLDDVWDRLGGKALTPDQEARLDDYLADRRAGRRTIDRYWDDADFSGREPRTEGRLAVLFPNVTWDSAVVGQGVAFDSIQDWIAATVEFFADRPSDELIIRLHPAEVKLPGKQTREPLGQFLTSRFPRLPDNVHVIAADDNASSYPLMEQADVGLVFTSTTGLECALVGTPVVVAGATHYRGKGFTLDAESPDDFRARLRKALDAPESVPTDIDLARRYANLFFFEAPVGSPGVEEHVPGLARLTVDRLDQLAPGADVDVDRICDGILHGTDFLPHA